MNQQRRRVAPPRRRTTDANSLPHVPTVRPTRESHAMSIALWRLGSTSKATRAALRAERLRFRAHLHVNVAALAGHVERRAKSGDIHLSCGLGVGVGDGHQWDDRAVGWRSWCAAPTPLHATLGADAARLRLQHRRNRSANGVAPKRGPGAVPSPTQPRREMEKE